MNIIKYEGTKDIFFAFAKEDDKHCLLIYSKTGTPNILISQEDTIIRGGFVDTVLGHIPTDIYSSLSVPLKPAIKFIAIKDEEEYNKLVSIIKELL